MRSIWIGFDGNPAEAVAFAIARYSIRRRLNLPIPVFGVVLADLQAQGLYTRPTERRDGKVYDVLSKRDDYDGAISTEFAISRFLVPHLAKRGWALFQDCDMLARADYSRLFEHLSAMRKYAVICVKHDHQPKNTEKMDGQKQTAYFRKNWSSFMLFNCDHPSNAALTPELVNSVPGRDLHRFCWLKDEEIGELGPEWNFLVGHTDPSVEPKNIHFTDGGPWLPAFENVPGSDLWRKEFYEWARR